MTAQTVRIIRSITALYALFLVAIVYTANAGVEHPGSVLVRNLPWGDKMGHIMLFGALTFVVNLALRCRTIRLGPFAVPLGTLLVSAVVVIEELSQGLLSNRTLDVADLAADAVGIVLATVAAVGLWGVIQRRRSATEPTTSTTVGDVNPTDHAGADIAESAGGESTVHLAEPIRIVDVDEGSIGQDPMLDSAFPGRSESEVEPEPDAVPVFESEPAPEPEAELEPESVADFDAEPETEQEAVHESVFYLDGDVEIDEPDDEVDEVGPIAETADEPSSESGNDPETESENESEPVEIDDWVAVVVAPVEQDERVERVGRAEQDEARGPVEAHQSEEQTAEVDVVIDVTEIESAADVMLPTMADLDEVSAELNRIDAALVALDQQR